MVGNEGTRGDYFEVNARLLGEIAAVGELVMSRPDNSQLTVIQPTYSDMARITVGMETADTIHALFAVTGETISDEEAAAIADKQRGEDIRKGVEYISQLQLLITEDSLTYHAGGDIREPADSDFVLPFEAASAQLHAISDSVELIVTSLSGVRFVGDVNRYIFTSHEGPIDHVLDIVMVNGNVHSVRASAEPTFEENLYEWTELFGDLTWDLADVIVGQFKTEFDLAMQLQWARASLAGKVEQTGLDSAINSIRDNALAMRRVNELNREFGETALQPNAARLGEWVERLSSF